MVGWNDGFSFVPLMFRLLSSAKEKKLSLRYRSEPIRKCGRRTPNQGKNEKTRHPDPDSKQSQTDETVLRLWGCVRMRIKERA